MNATQLFLKFHDDLEWYGLHLLERLSEAQLRVRPHPDVNSLAWLFWHMARGEDFGVQRLVGGRPQILDQAGWMERLKVPVRHCGTGMSDDAVSDLSARIDLTALRAYWEAVRVATPAVVATLEPEALDEVIDAAYLHQVLFDEGAFEPREVAAGIEAFYRGHNKGWFLTHLGITHNYGHFYEAATVCKLMGVEFWS